MADFKPRYPQPFSLSEAVGLDVSVITQEIARLEDSIRRLRETQVQLKEHVSSSTPENVDPEFTLAIEENEIVIGSQEERVEMLKAALTEKGVSSTEHYTSSVTAVGRDQGSIPRVHSGLSESGQDNVDGVYL